MELSEILRLAGADEDAETFQVALEGKPRPGSMLAIQPAASARRALAEKRGYAAPMPYNLHADRVYSRMCVAVDALGEVNGVVVDLWKCLDRMRFGEDPESGFGEAAARIQEGPLSDIEKLVKGVGFALDQGFDRRGEHETVGPMGMVKMLGPLGVHGLDTCCLHLRGEVAEALAILKIVAPEIDKASPRDLPEIDADLWKKTGSAFLKNIEGRVDVLCAAIEKLVEKRMASKSGAMADAADRQMLAQGAELAEAVFALPPERQNWSTGLSEAAGDRGALRLMLPLTPNYDKNEVYAFVKSLNAKLAKDKKLSAGMTSKFDATQVTDMDFTSGSVTLWFAMAPEAKADAAHAKLLADLVADAVLGYENADILFHWDGDAERPAKGTYAARELEIDVVESVEQMHADIVEGGGSQAWRLGMVFHAPGSEFNDAMWILPFEATKNGAATKVHLVKWPAGKKKPLPAKQAGGWDDRAFNSNNAKAVEVQDIPAEVLALLKATGAMKGPSAPAMEDRYAAMMESSAADYENAMRAAVKSAFGADAGKKAEVSFKLAPAEKIWGTADPKLAQVVGSVTISLSTSKGLVTRGVRVEATGANGVRLTLIKKTGGVTTSKWSDVESMDVAATPETVGEGVEQLFRTLLKKKVAEAARAVFVVKMTIPAHKPSAAASDPEAWTAEEEKMASDFELAMERSPIKSAMAPKAMVKVTKIGFAGTGAKYALNVTAEVSGEGVSSADDDLITALDKRAEAALDAVVDNGEQAAEAAFGDLRWDHTTIEVL